MWTLYSLIYTLVERTRAQCKSCLFMWIWKSKLPGLILQPCPSLQWKLPAGVSPWWMWRLTSSSALGFHSSMASSLHCRRGWGFGRKADPTWFQLGGMQRSSGGYCLYKQCAVLRSHNLIARDNYKLQTFLVRPQQSVWGSEPRTPHRLLKKLFESMKLHHLLNPTFVLRWDASFLDSNFLQSCCLIANSRLLIHPWKLQWPKSTVASKAWDTNNVTSNLRMQVRGFDLPQAEQNALI